MTDTPPDHSHDAPQSFAAAVAAMEGAEAFRLYGERLHGFVRSGDQRALLDASRQAIVSLARAERWAPSVMLKAVRHRCYLEKAGPAEVDRFAEEVDRLLYAYFNGHGADAIGSGL